MPLVIYDHFGPGLYIATDPDDKTFLGEAQRALNELRKQKAGADLIRQINTVCSGKARMFKFLGRKNKRTVVIKGSPGPHL